jgi:hypothetical protein
VPKDRARNDERSRIAHLAARLMAEDGIDDYGAAKRKAARQAGVADTRHLPTNDEIDEALRSYRELYGAQAHRAQLHALRLQAVATMREFARFNPYLTGPVLTGSAGKYAGISLHLYAESPKSVELDLMNRNIRYRAGQCRLHVGTATQTVPLFTLADAAVETELVVLDQDDLRVPVRTSAEGHPIERAKIEEVEALLAESS